MTEVFNIYVRINNDEEILLKKLLILRELRIDIN